VLAAAPTGKLQCRLQHATAAGAAECAYQ
jgi:hypothetical protein